MRSVSFTKGMSASNEGDRFLVIHPHATKGLTNLFSRGERIRVTVRTLGVHIDQTHLNGRKRVIKLTIIVTFLGQPLALRPPINIFLRLPHIGAASSEAKGFETHGLKSHVATQNHEVGP